MLHVASAMQPVPDGSQASLTPRDVQESKEDAY